MVTFTGRYTGEEGGAKVLRRLVFRQWGAEVGKDFCPNLIKQLLGNVDSRNDETWNLVEQYFTNLIETANSLFFEVPRRCSL